MAQTEDAENRLEPRTTVRKAKFDGFTSKTNAKKAHVGEFCREAGVIGKAANDLNMALNHLLIELHACMC